MIILWLCVYYRVTWTDMQRVVNSLKRLNTSPNSPWTSYFAVPSHIIQTARQRPGKQYRGVCVCVCVCVRACVRVCVPAIA